MSKKKKIIVLIGMVCLLVVSGYLNIVLNNKAVSTSGQVATSNIFDSYRSDRLTTRNQEISYYDAIIASASTSTDAKTVAETKRQAILDFMDNEMVAEGLIKAKGFEDAFITSSNSLISVVVKSAELTKSEVAQIYTIVKEQLNGNISNVEIIPVE